MSKMVSLKTSIFGESKEYNISKNMFIESYSKHYADVVSERIGRNIAFKNKMDKEAERRTLVEFLGEEIANEILYIGIIMIPISISALPEEN